MSLTSFLNSDRDLRTRLREEFPKPKLPRGVDIVAPPLTLNFSPVGTAYDYLLRFHLERLNHGRVRKNRWIAEQALLLLSGRELTQAERAVRDAKRRLLRFVESGRLTEGLIRSAILLARLDPIFRADVGHEYIGLIDEGDVQDLKNLISATDLLLFEAKCRCLLNPNFDEASRMVGGADADLIIDDTLIEIKTTKRFTFKRDCFNQLIGYYTLYGIGRFRPRGRSLPEIKRIAVYFSRFSYMHVMAVEDIIDRGTFPRFAKWFSRRADKYMARS